jgi:hypothetical protein
VTNRMLPRLGAACGALFAVPLFAASGHSGHVHIAALAAFALFLPFLAYLCSLLREAEGENGWLSTTAFAAGLTGITIKLLSAAPEIANRHVTSGTPLHKALQDIADAATGISLYPLAVMFAAVTILTFRTRVLPRWLGFGAAAVAIALAVMGSFIGRNAGPALILFVLWTLVTSVVLFRRTWREPTQVARAYASAPS